MHRHVDEILFDNHEYAEEVLNYLTKTIEQCGSVTVFDLYRYIGDANSPTYETWGWTDLSDARVVMTGKGAWRSGGLQERYRILLPKAVLLLIKKQEMHTITAKEYLDGEDNKAILEVLGTEYTMILNRDVITGHFIMEVSDTKNHRVTKDISMLEVVNAAHNVLLVHIKHAILLLEAMTITDTSDTQ